MKFPKIKNRMNVWMYLALGYLVVVIIGSVLLVLPVASRTGETLYVDALFTSFSAACVTGLVPFETGVHWTTFGQVVILLLIQCGGLGFMTFISVVLLAVKRNLGQYERNAVVQSVGGQMGSVKRLVRHIFVGTAAFEGLGAGILCIRFVPKFGARGMWYAVFHAVSAFCNAGFDLFGGTEAAGVGSLSYFATDPLVSLTICVLIIVGGLGFCIWGDVLDCRCNPKKFQFYTKVILIVNSLLLTVSTLLFLLFERNNPSYAGYNFGQRLLASFFNATTARTAGFYTTDPASFSGSGYLLTVILMFIGGSSGSTAGGIKVGTFTVIVMGMLAAFRGSRDINVGRRRIDIKLLSRALAIFAAYLILILMGTLVICAVEPDGGDSLGLFGKALFETVSALGTVGLTVSFTNTLSVVSKVVLMLLMYAGRAGVFTLAYALSRKKSTSEIRRPVDSFFIG